MGNRSWCAGGFDDRPVQTTAEIVERALAAAPRQMREAATVNQMEARLHVRDAEAGHEPSGLLPRVKPEYGSVWYSLAGPDQAGARLHTTIAVPGATTQVDSIAGSQ